MHNPFLRCKNCGKVLDPHYADNCDECGYNHCMDCMIETEPEHYICVNCAPGKESEEA